MKSISSKNTFIWILLIGLTIITSLFFKSRYAVIIILFIALIKLCLVAFQFMELKRAHAIWKVLFVFIIGLILTIIGFSVA